MLGVQKTKQQLVRLYRVLFGAKVGAAGDKMDAWLAQRTVTQFDPSQNQSSIVLRKGSIVQSCTIFGAHFAAARNAFGTYLRLFMRRNRPIYIQTARVESLT